MLKTDGAAINVFGGKLTTSRRLAEAVLDKIELILGKKSPAWTKIAKLPGGEFEPLAFDAEVRRLGMDYGWLPPKLAYRLCRLYGTRARMVLGDAKDLAGLGPQFGADLFGREVDYLVDHEWARTAQDVLWRRTKLGLRVGPEDVARLEAYLAERG